MQLTHKIALNPTVEQAAYFKKAAGTSRFVWNWGLAKWQEQYSVGQKPNAMALKKIFNAIKYEEFPWLHEMHRDSHAQPFTYLAKAWNRFFKEIKANKTAHEPTFKKKNRSRDSFYVANDKFSINETTIRLPKIGAVAMTEALRFEGKILGATISRTADKWFVAIQVDLPNAKAKKQRTSHHTVGVDLGIKAAVTLSTDESIVAPKPLKSALRRLQIRGRAVSRKIEAAKQTINISKKQRLPKGTRLPLSNNRKKSSLTLARLHARITNLRADFTHKLTTRLCCENQVVVIEDLHVAGMLKNEKLARAISDVGFGAIRRQLEYKSLRYDTRLIIADRWYPSSKLCSFCHWKNDLLMLKDREWTCQQCGVLHDRDINAARNLKRLATKTALPEASQSATNDTGLGMVPFLGGKVTPVRYECGRQDTSGQEINREHICSHF
jgi:putative transposase